MCAQTKIAEGIRLGKIVGGSGYDIQLENHILADMMTPLKCEIDRVFDLKVNYVNKKPFDEDNEESLMFPDEGVGEIGTGTDQQVGGRPPNSYFLHRRRRRVMKKERFWVFVNL